MIPAGSFALAAALAGVGYAAGWLTVDGVAAATIVGGAVFAGSGWAGGLLLALFFVSGSVLTQLNRRLGEAEPASPKAARNARQVLANGLGAAVGAAMIPWRPLDGWAILTGSLAAAQSDTWATEIGARSKTPPRMITTGATVAPGTSGGITLRGTVGGAAGALLTATLARATGVPAAAVIGGAAGGLIGMFLDSLLGATVQARFECVACAEVTERKRHRCGAAPRLVRGWRWLDNDGVNILATAAGGCFAALLSSLA